MMKLILIVRHAKSSWSSPSLSDFDRPLNDRGKRDAPEMARRLKEKRIIPDLLVSSTAVRALSTARYFAEGFGIAQNKIMEVPSLYHAPASVFYETLASIPDDKGFETIALFSHNPGITAFVNDLELATIDNMPTCGVFGFRAKTDSWKDVADAEKSFWFFDAPKL